MTDTQDSFLPKFTVVLLLCLIAALIGGAYWWFFGGRGDSLTAFYGASSSGSRTAYDSGRITDTGSRPSLSVERRDETPPPALSLFRDPDAVPMPESAPSRLDSAVHPTLLEPLPETPSAVEEPSTPLPPAEQAEIVPPVVEEPSPRDDTLGGPDLLERATTETGQTPGSDVGNRQDSSSAESTPAIDERDAMDEAPVTRGLAVEENPTIPIADENVVAKPQDVSPPLAENPGDEHVTEVPQATTTPIPAPVQPPPAPEPYATVPGDPVIPEQDAETNEISIILYSKGTTMKEDKSLARGSVPEDQKALPLPPQSVPLEDDPLESDFEHPSVDSFEPLAVQRPDSVMTPMLLDDLARFLAENYWPQGTHPLARNRGISTAGVKWANMRFGGQLRGFNVDPLNLPAERQRVLDYVFMPSMIQALYNLYTERFFHSLEQEAQRQMRGKGQTPLTTAQMAEMYGIYAETVRGLAGTIRVFVHAPGVRDATREYAATSETAAQAFARFSEASDANGRVDKTSVTNTYQAAVMAREKKHGTMTTAIRKGGNTRGVDSDTVVYVALWLLRRGEDQEQTFLALATILDTASERLRKEQTRYQAKNPRQTAKHQKR